MKAPLAWLRDYVDVPDDVDAIVEKLAQLGFPVEHVETRPQMSGVVVGKIVAQEKHPNADRLQVCTIDVGMEDDLTIATAAVNTAVGQYVPVAKIGAELAGGLSIGPRSMRGVESQGMLCSAAELGLEAAWFEDGILQLDPGIPLGLEVIERFHLSDPVLDVEVTSNRVDVLSMIGLARELAAGFGSEIRVPETSVSYGGVRIDDAGNVSTGLLDSFDVKVELRSPDCRRLVVQRISDVRVRQSKTWMRIRLALAGQRPINNIVDISNFVMLEVGQPLHFYDFDMLADRSLIVRDARDGEELQTLDGEYHTLTPNILVVADAENAQGIAGVKGGKLTEVSALTRSIAIEAAIFNGARVRRSAKALGMRTEASARHEKTLPAAFADMGAARAARLLEQEGATIHMPRSVGAAVPQASILDLRKREIPRLLGYALDNDAIAEHLRALGFEARTMLTDELIAMLELDPKEIDAISSFEVVVPAWRADVTQEVDLVEEIGRIVGYDRVPEAIPAVSDQAIPSTAWTQQTTVARAMVALGYREVVALGLQPASVAERWVTSGVAALATPVEVANPLSEDQRFLRFSLIPGMLGLGLDRIFEIGDVFARAADITERTQLAFVRRTRAPQSAPWADPEFTAIKADALAFVRALTGRPATVRAAQHSGWHPGICAELVLDGAAVAIVGALDPRLAFAYDVEDRVHVAQVDLSALPAYTTPVYTPPPRYPSVTRDLALVLAPEIEATAVERAIVQSGGAHVRSARAFDEYRGPQLGEGKKSLTVRVVLQRDDATMTDDEADAAISAMLTALREQFGATIRA